MFWHISFHISQFDTASINSKPHIFLKQFVAVRKRFQLSCVTKRTKQSLLNLHSTMRIISCWLFISDKNLTKIKSIILLSSPHPMKKLYRSNVDSTAECWNFGNLLSSDMSLLTRYRTYRVFATAIIKPYRLCDLKAGAEPSLAIWLFVNRWIGEAVTEWDWRVLCKDTTQKTLVACQRLKRESSGTVQQLDLSVVRYFFIVLLSVLYFYKYTGVLLYSKPCFESIFRHMFTNNGQSFWQGLHAVEWNICWVAVSCKFNIRVH